MKTGKSLVELAQELERQRYAKRDFVAPVGAVSMELTEEKSPVLSLGETGSFGVTEIAHDQVAEFVGIPNKYYRKMRTEAPELLTDNVNHWFSKSNGTQRMVRTLDGKARAFLSDRYRPLDNQDLADVALPALLEGGCRVESCEVTEKRMYIKAVTEKLTYEVKKGDVIQAGIVISNSEVGMGALSVEPLLYRLVCTNGMIVNDAKMRRTHVGRGNEQFDGVSEFFKDATKEADDRAFWMKVRDVITAAFTTIGFEKFVEKFAAAAADKITADPIKVVEVTQKHFGLNEFERNGILKHLLVDGDLSKFGLANAVTRTAQDVESYDRATELERLGGNIIELPKRDWSLIAEAA